MTSPFPELNPEEAAALIQHDQTIGFSGFTPAGACKAIPRALAKKAIAEHEAGKDFKIAVVTGASTGPSLDGELAKADAIKWRTPYQTDSHLRKAINEGRTRFFDMHLSQLPQYVRYGFLGKFDWAIIEAADVTPYGEIIPTTSVGASPAFTDMAENILIEVNSAHPKKLRGMHDIFNLENPPLRREIPIHRVDDRIGTPAIHVDPRKIRGIVYTNERDEGRPFTAPDAVSQKLGNNVADFLAKEMKAGRIPPEFLPLQSGVGNVANALMIALAEHPDIPTFEMYSEVIQDSVVDAIKGGHISFVSGCSLSVSQECLDEIYSNLDFFRSKIVLRPQDITNSPEVVRRLGVISINTALEADIFGNVNSTHVLGKKMMNGIGGSGDFTRNAFISMFTCPSTAKGGLISAIVPLCSHMDHSEHSVQVLATEQGVADLRGKDPHQRAMTIVDNCAHPDFRDELHGYFDSVKDGQTPQTLEKAFAMHIKFMETGDMRGVDWNWKQPAGV